MIIMVDYRSSKKSNEVISKMIVIINMSDMITMEDIRGVGIYKNMSAMFYMKKCRDRSSHKNYRESIWYHVKS